MLCCTSKPFTIFSMLFNSEGELEGILVTIDVGGWRGGTTGILAVVVVPASVDPGEVGFWVGVGDTDIGLVGGEFEAARG